MFNLCNIPHNPITETQEVRQAKFDKIHRDYLNARGITQKEYLAEVALEAKEALKYFQKNPIASIKEMSDVEMDLFL